MPDAHDLIREYEMLVGQRGTWETHWQDIAEVVLPHSREFTTIREEKGSKRQDKVFDSTAPIALERFGAALDSLLTPRAQKWHRLRATLPELNEDIEVMRWFDAVNDLLFRYRYVTSANFEGEIGKTRLQLGAFGTGALFIDEASVRGFRYSGLHLADLFFAVNHQGIVDTVFRRIQMTAHAARMKPEWEGLLPDKIMKCTNPYIDYEFLHVVKPRMDYDPTRADFMGMPYASYYISMEGKVMLDEGGYNQFPYSISRYTQAPRETYGRSPAMAALPDIRMLNEMSKSDIRAVHKLVDPPLLIHDDGILGAGSMSVNLDPGQINYGGVSPDGRQLIQPLQTGARVDIADSKMDQRRRAINDTFLVTLFQILVDQPSMTATEALIRAREKGELLGPTLGRQQSEALGPMIEREIGILERQGLIPEMPGLLIEAEGEYDIVYDSPLNRLQRSEELIGISRTLETIAPFAQADPNVLRIFNTQEIVKIAADINGVPAKVLRSDDELEAMMQSEAAANQEAQTLQQIPVAASAAKDLAQAQALLREPVAV